MIGLCTITFLAQLAAESRGVAMVERWGMIPARIENPDIDIVLTQEVLVDTPYGVQRQTVEKQLQPSAVPPVFTLLTCIFLHGGWLHYLGNMWFLYIFGDNVEDRLGHWQYGLFYLAAGVAASATHLLTNQQSNIPTIGASGAIAGVMGAYMCMYPKAMVLSVIPIFIILEMIVLPAPVFLGIWFAMQFFQGVATITNEPTSGVAWWAHIGGFVMGFAVAKILGTCHRLRPAVPERRLGTESPRMYRTHRRDIW